MVLALLILTAAVSYASYGFACYHYLQTGRLLGALVMMNLAAGTFLYAKNQGFVVSDFSGMLCVMSGVLAFFSVLKFGILKYLHVPTRY